MATYDESLLPPYLNSFTVDLTDAKKAKYPEKSKIGAGRRALYPYSLFLVPYWPGLVASEYLGLRVGNLEEPIASIKFTVEDIEKINKDGLPHYIFEVPASKLVEGDAVPYICRVVRSSGNESRSPIQTMLIKLTVPGGYDRRPWEPWHSGLIMWIEELAPGSIINADVAAGGLTCVIPPYLNIRYNDKIIVSADGIEVPHIVSPAEAKSTQPIRITIEEDVLLSMSKKGVVAFAFTVEDVVKNAPEGKYRYSMPLEYISELDLLAVDAPTFLVLGEVAYKLDLDEHSQSALSVEVSLVIDKKVLKSPNEAHVILETRDKLGAVEVVRLPIVKATGRRTVEVPIPNSVVTKLAGGQFRVWCEYKTPAGGLLGTSSSILIMAVGTPTVMPPVRLLPPCRGRIIPRDTTAPVEMPYYTPHDEHNAEIIYASNASTGGSQLVPFIEIAGPQGDIRQLAKAKLQVFDKKGPFNLYYQTDDGKGTPGSIRTSEPLSVEIGDVIPELPKMHIPDALNGNLDLANVSGAYIEAFITYTGTVVKQKVNYSIVGETSSSQNFITGTISIIAALAGVNLTELGIRIPLDFLKANNNSSFRIYYNVETPGSPSTFLYSEPHEITVGPPVVLKPLRILEADPVNGTLKPNKVTQGATLRIGHSPVMGGVVSWQWFGEHDVSQIEGKTSVDPKTGFVDVDIPYGVIAKGLRPDGNNITVTAVLNKGGKSYPFETLNILLLPLKVLPTPYIDGFEHSTVLPIDLVAEGARINVPVWDFMLVDEVKWCTCKGTLEDGEAYIKEVIIAEKVTASELQKGVSMRVPEGLDTLKEGSLFTISFLASFPKIPSLQTATPFPVANYIIQKLPMELPYPTLNGVSSTAQEITVDPLSLEKSTSVTVKIPNGTVKDSVTLDWIFQDGTKYSKTLPGTAGGTLVFDLTPAQVVHNSVNSVIQLQCFLVRGGKTILSKVQTVTIETIAATSLPRALINNLAQGASLALNSFAGNAKATIAKWPLSKVGHRVNLSIIAGGRELKILDGYTISALEATNGIVDKAVSRDWIAGIANGSTVELKLSVEFYGDKGTARATPFPTTNYTANTRLQPPVITLAFIASTGATLPYGGAYSNALGLGVVFRGTCDSRPYARGVRLGQANGGGYGFTIPAYATTWESWTGFGPVNQWFSVALYDGPDNVTSNFVSWYRN
ncbi:hypothetical protein [Pseudomonas salomonii]|uniref:Ig-like domain-containing protein n=1 Tax=Pseudomonas salomonii TaxID=191391 RepID=A0ABS9GR78_9PSED|nr:hypothetical protein [Pseudomonas salomonii]MCF5547001.1 hypothetical protein [Pseudomonas salomonii]